MYRDLLAEQRNPVIGIDLGTTNSLVAVATDCSTRIIASPEGRQSLPSVLHRDACGAISVGHEARAQRLIDPAGTISSIKRFMGMKLDQAQEHADEVSYQLSSDNDKIAGVRLGDQVLSAPEISAEYLKELRRWAEQDIGKTLHEAVITVPAYFNDAQRQATRDAATIAGLKVLRIVNEPTAAALAYGLQKDTQGQVAVYDFGGGTFDVSILELHDGVFEVLATGGNTRLGGDDIDWRVASELYSLSPLANTEIGELSKADAHIRQKFVSAAEGAKIALSTQPFVELVIALPTGEWSYRLDRSQLEEWAAPVVEETLKISRQVLKDSAIDLSGLAEVLLVGGSSRMPLVQRQVQELFGRVPRYDLDPDHVVALGAAVQGRILAGGLDHMLLLDVTPLSLGLESWGGAFDVVIPRNTTVPASAKQMFTNNVDGQTKVMIHVLQGERELANDNQSIGKLTLSGLPPMPAGQARIEVTFTLDADGVLRVSAKELNSGKATTATMEPSSGLSREEIDEIVRESFANAQNDLHQRLLLDRRIEAENLLKAVGKALDQSGNELEPAARASIEGTANALQEALQGQDEERIKRATQKLNDLTDDLATLQMNALLTSSLQGRSLEDVREHGSGLGN